MTGNLSGEWTAARCDLHGTVGKLLASSVSRPGSWIRHCNPSCVCLRELVAGHRSIYGRVFSGEQFLFCRFTQLTVLRLLTTDQIMGKDTKTMSGAWDLWHRVWADTRIVFLPEPD